MTRLAMLFALLLPGQLVAQDSPPQDTSRMRAAFEAHRGDFDYLLGDWQFTASNTEFGDFQGRWSAVRLATGGGAHVLDEYRVMGPDGETYFASTTLRALNAVSGEWELVSAADGVGVQDFGTARRVGDEMHIEQRFGVARGATELWHIRYYDIRADSFSWSADRSLDNGTTWERNYMRLQARRIGPPRSLDPLTGIRPSS